MLNFSLRARLILGAVLIQSAVFALVIFNADRTAHGFLKDQVRVRVETIQPLLNAAIAGPLAQHDYATLNDVLHEIRQTHTIEHIEVIDGNGILVGKAGETCIGTRIDGSVGSTCHDGHAETGMALRIQGQTVGKVNFGISISFLQVARDSMAKQSGLIAIIGLTIATILLFIFNWWLTRNLALLRVAVEKIGHGEYGIETGIKPGEHDEIAKLAHSFDAMSRQIKCSHEGMFKEIEERKRAELLLRENEQHFRTLANGGSTLIWTADPDKSCNYFNEPWLRFTGRALEQEVGNGWVEGVHPEDINRCLKIYVSSFDQRQSFSMEYRLHHADGTYHWLRDDGNPRYDSEGQFIGYIGFCVDITSQKENSAELERYRQHLESIVEKRTSALKIAKDAAETANRAKSTFLANMSHELRTPMNAIMGMTSMALRHATDPKLVDQLTKVTQASRHLLSIINDILDISKIEAERVKLEKISFRVDETLENLRSMIGQKLAEKKLDLIIDASEITGLSLRGDPVRLGQILLNLVGNALKFTDQGAITIHARLAEVGASDIQLRFEVLDTGIGIALEDQKRLFTAFEQADGSMTRKYGGTGLGLAISRRLVQLMGGEIGVKSKPGQGSTFWFTARFEKSTDDALPTLTSDCNSAEMRIQALSAGIRILLAEDEPINQEVSRGLLEDVGLTVDLAQDGKEAVALAGKCHYDLIFMDIQMPHLNGMDATRAIRRLPGYEITPILAMTANAFGEDRQTCLDAGMNDHIAKPVDPDVLYETLAKWLSSSRA